VRGLENGSKIAAIHCRAVTRDRRLAVSTVAFGAATALSRAAGLVREAVAAGVLGSGPAASAFQIAFNVPNLVRSLVADTALGAALVPVFAELRERGDEREAWRAASILLWLVAVVLGTLAALFVLLAPQVMPLFVWGDENVSTDLVVELSRWLFPIVPLLGLTGIVTAILNSYDIFGVPALAPVAWNATIVAGLLLFATSGSFADRAEVYAIAVLVATVVQLLIPLPLLGGRGTGIVWDLTWGNPHVRRVLRLMLPVTIGLGLINLNLTLSLAVASLASAHAVSDLAYAFRLYMLPQGLFSVAVTVVLFPELSRLAARGDRAGLAARVAAGTRTIAFLLLPAAAFTLVFAHPIASVVYERGGFTAEDSDHVAATLRAYSLGLVTNGLALLLTRSFFALQEPGVPTRVAAGNLVLNLVLALALYDSLDAAGIALATSIVTAWNALVLALLLRRRCGGLGLRAVARELRLIAVAAVVAIAVSFAAWAAVAAAAGDSLVAQAVGLAAALAAAAAVYLGLGRLLGLADVALLQGLVPRRWTGRAG
jgi:putative peptidoglycan lipid II flippase